LTLNIKTKKSTITSAASITSTE